MPCKLEVYFIPSVKCRFSEFDADVACFSIVSTGLGTEVPGVAHLSASCGAWVPASGRQMKKTA